MHIAYNINTLLLTKDTGDGEVEWTEVEQGIVDSELSAAGMKGGIQCSNTCTTTPNTLNIPGLNVIISGMLWVVSKKKLYKMRPFTDLDLQVVTGPTLKSKVRQHWNVVTRISTKVLHVLNQVHNDNS